MGDATFVTGDGSAAPQKGYLLAARMPYLCPKGGSCT